MKKHLFSFIILCTLFGSLRAQMHLNRSYHSINEAPNSFLLNISGDLYFATEERSDPSEFGSSTLYRHSPTGALKFRKQSLPGYRMPVCFESNDHKLVMAGMTTIICDVMLPQHNLLAKVDTNGQAVFTSTYAVSNGDSPKACVQLADSSYYSFTDSLAFKHSKTGQLVSKINLGITSISSAMVLQSNNILLSANIGGVSYLMELTPALSPGPMAMTPVLMKKLSYYGSQQILALGADGKLYKYSPAYGLINASSFTGGMDVTDFVCRNDTIYSLLASPSVPSSYAITDTLFSIINLSSTTTNNISQRAICMSGSNVAILAAGAAKQAPTWPNPVHNFASLSIMSPSASNNFLSDVAVTFVDVDSAYTTPSPQNYPFLRARVTVKNVGARPVTKFKLNCIESPAIACGVFIYQEEFSGLLLYQGDSVTVTTGRFVNRLYGGINSDFCFYTTLPNGETDKTLEDNEICVNFAVITSLKERNMNTVALRVHPNPFQQELKIESDSRIRSLECVNALGMLVYKAEVGDNQFTLDNSQLPAGIYFMKVDTEKGSVTKKIIRQ